MLKIKLFINRFTVSSNIPWTLPSDYPLAAVSAIGIFRCSDHHSNRYRKLPTIQLLLVGMLVMTFR